jgi:transcriptional regulator with PAS, ATPase and Fis domain
MGGKKGTKPDSRQIVANGQEQFQAYVKRTVAQRLGDAVLYESINRAGPGATRAQILDAADTVMAETLKQISSKKLKELGDRPKIPSPETFNYCIKSALAAVEKLMILSVMQFADGNRSLAARILEIPSRSLSYKIKGYGLLDKVKQRGPFDNKAVYKDDSWSIKKMARELETCFIVAALEKTEGDRTAAAKMLGISSRSLLYKMKEYKIS